MTWTYAQADPALMLWTAAVTRFGLTLPAGARVLELGCQETDFLERLKRQNPTLDLWGMDWNRGRDANGWTFVQGDATNPADWPAGDFDAIIALGALEHFGLGFYGDPVNDVGDVRCVQIAATRLRRGGWLYADVPCQPVSRVSENRHYRMYAPEDVAPLLLGTWLRERARGYSLPEPEAGVWVEAPTVERVPYWFVAIVAERP